MGRRWKTKMGPAKAALRAALRGDVRALLLVESGARLLRLCAMVCLAGLVGSLVMEGVLPIRLLIGAAGCLGLSVVLSAWAEGRTAQLETKASNRVLDWFWAFTARGQLADVQAMEAGDLANRISRQPRAAARSMVSVSIGRSMAAIGAMMALALMALLSWQAALLLLLTMPMMVLFFIIVGHLTKARAAAQEAAIQELSGAFAEKVRCLPTIVACDAPEREAGRLSLLLHEYRTRSSQLLRAAFLNAAVLDFFSSLSIAMLAIFLGLGHLGLVSFPGFSGLTLSTTLGLLILAPEVFQPLRRYSELYHQAAEGEEALTALDPIATVAPHKDVRLPLGRLGMRGLVLANGAELGDRDLPETGLIAVTGPSGTGKTMLLRSLAGLEAPKAGQVFRPAGDAAWIAMDSWLPEDLLLNHLMPDDLEALRLNDDPRFEGDLSAIDLGEGEVSGGQRVRLALTYARSQDAAVLFADEPTAKLDHKSADAVRQALLQAARNRLVITATHDPALMALADERIDLEARGEVIA